MIAISSAAATAPMLTRRWQSKLPFLCRAVGRYAALHKGSYFGG